MILGGFWKPGKKAHERGGCKRTKSIKFLDENKCISKYFGGVTTLEGEAIFDETVVKILDPFVGLNFTMELQDISSAVFQMKNEGICQLELRNSCKK